MKRRKSTNDMMGIMKTGVMWGVGSSVISSVTPASGIGKTTGDFAQAGLSIIAIKDISKKIKW
jgi:hypothetical protein